MMMMMMIMMMMMKEKYTLFHKILYSYNYLSKTTEGIKLIKYNSHNCYKHADKVVYKIELLP